MACFSLRRTPEVTHSKTTTTTKIKTKTNRLEKKRKEKKKTKTKTNENKSATTAACNGWRESYCVVKLLMSDS